MSHVKTNVHGLHYDYHGIRPVVTDSHMLTGDAHMAIQFANHMLMAGWEKELTVPEIAAIACDLAEQLQAEFAKRRWRVKTPPVDADELERAYRIKKPEGAA